MFRLDRVPLVFSSINTLAGLVIQLGIWLSGISLLEVQIYESLVCADKKVINPEFNIKQLCYI